MTDARWHSYDNGWMLTVYTPPEPDGFYDWIGARVNPQGWSAWRSALGDWPEREGPETGSEGIQKATEAFLSMQSGEIHVVQ